MNKPDLQNLDYSNFSLSDLNPKNLFNRAKKDVKNAGDKIKSATDKAKSDLKNIKSAKDAFKLFAYKTSKFNPAATVPRAAALLLARINFLGISRKLYAGLLSDSELKAKHYNVENAKILRTLWDKNLTEYWNVLGGDISSLKKAVRKGFDKAIFKTKKVKAAKRAERGESFDGGEDETKYLLSDFNTWANDYDLSTVDRDINLNFKRDYVNDVDPSIISAAIAAGGAVVIAAIGAMAKKAGAKDNPFDPSSPNYKAAELDPPPVAPILSKMDEDQLKEIELLALEDRRLHGLDADSYEAELDAIEEKYDKIFGIPKKWAIGGGTAIILVVGFLIYKKNNK